MEQVKPGQVMWFWISPRYLTGEVFWACLSSLQEGFCFSDVWEDLWVSQNCKMFLWRRTSFLVGAVLGPDPDKGVDMNGCKKAFKCQKYFSKPAKITKRI